MSGCIFCKLADRQIPCQAVWESDDILAFRDLHPQAPTHILLIPKRHISSVAEADAKDRHLLGELLLAAGAVAEKENLGSQFRLVINTGSEAGQSVFHLHIHLLGGRSLGWPPG